ncbi:Abscisic acid receptor pyr1 [Thalictrum thalictroides]|uniref:Abscisic acid receptor pyr1 n=1 Tax=Thalictrum thalictroides TaxID=46969 RepID=A0A7J6VQ11_THATH|nr:Abscisic acid receptor pyr1 [Thalictrum thalictroides]
MEILPSSSPPKCSSVLVQHINAPVPLVWSIVRRFDKPELYKRFVQTTTMLSGDGDNIGCVRKVQIVSGLPAQVSIERLNLLEANLHVISFSIVGGDHRLANYRSTMLLLEKNDEADKTTVMESYTVDAPTGSSKEDTCYFVENIIRWNLESLASVAERMTSVP